MAQFDKLGLARPLIIPVPDSEMRSVPPRGSGWVSVAFYSLIFDLQLKLGNQDSPATALWY